MQPASPEAASSPASPTQEEKESEDEINEESDFEWEHKDAEESLHETRLAEVGSCSQEAERSALGEDTMDEQPKQEDKRKRSAIVKSKRWGVPLRVQEEHSLTERIEELKKKQKQIKKAKAEEARKASEQA